MLEDCGTLIKGKNATNLVNHLKSWHKDVAATCRRRIRKKQIKTHSHYYRLVAYNIAAKNLANLHNKSARSVLMHEFCSMI